MMGVMVSGVNNFYYLRYTGNLLSSCARVNTNVKLYTTGIGQFISWFKTGNMIDLNNPKNYYFQERVVYFVPFKKQNI